MQNLTKAQIKQLLMEQQGFAGVPKLWKKPGEAITATGGFKHKGKGGTCQVSWGICPGSDWPYEYKEEKVVWVTGGTKNIVLTDNADWKTYPFSLSGTFPNIEPGDEGNFFDCLVGIQLPIGTWAAGWVKDKDYWMFDDIYGRSDRVVGVAEFKELTSIFS